MFKENNLEEIYNKYRENKLAHAYLIETNNIEKLLTDLKKLIKVLNCPDSYAEDCQKCNLCNLINLNNLPNLITIEPEGTSIKKSQIESLKNSFETKPIYSKYNIYIIKNAEKLNGSSANAMLKFVEEPTEGILGFFITDNKDIIIPTIKSRCQILVVNYPDDSIITKLNITNEELTAYLTFINSYIENINSKTFINNKEFVLSKFSERKQIEIIFKLIFEIYQNLFLKSLNKTYNTELCQNYKIDLNFSKIVNILNILAKFLQDLSYNINIELLLDKFVIEMRNTGG